MMPWIMDYSRPYATVYGDESYRYVQDGIQFLSDGTVKDIDAARKSITISVPDNPGIRDEPYDPPMMTPEQIADLEAESENALSS